MGKMTGKTLRRRRVMVILADEEWASVSAVLADWGQKRGLGTGGKLPGEWDEREKRVGLALNTIRDSRDAAKGVSRETDVQDQD